MTSTGPARAEIVVDLAAIRHNVRRLREIVGPDVAMMTVVKAASEAVLAVSPRVSLVLKADIRPGHKDQMTRKVRSVEERLKGER